MGKLTVIPVCNDKDVKANGKFGIYIDGELKGEFTFEQPVSFEISKACVVAAMYEGMSYSKLRINADENITLVLEYDAFYGDVRFTKKKYEKSDDAKKDDAYYENNETADETVLKTKKGMFSKLSEIGGWVHRAFLILFILIILGVVISFFVLLAEDMIGAAFIVLGSGIMFCRVYYYEYLLAGYFYFAAMDKGYTDLMYLFFPWAFPVVGHLLIAALPDRGEGRNYEKDKE